MGHSRRTLTAALLLTTALTLAGCAGDADPAATPSPEEPTTTSEPEPSETPTEAPDDDGSEGELPGTPFDSGPTAGDELAVVGVEADDTLNLRSGPGAEFDVVGELEPLGTAEATGDNRIVDGAGVWVEVTGDGATGWANLTYLAYLGEVTDITSELAVLPAGGDLVELAQAVARERLGESTEGRQQVTVVDGPTIGDLAEVTVDLTGFADDSVLGARLHVFAQADGDGFAVRTVEATTLCARGVDDERRCV